MDIPPGKRCEGRGGPLAEVSFSRSLQRRLQTFETAGPGRCWSGKGPQLAYGRHAGPAPADARQAAVSLMLIHHQDELFIPLTRRPAELKHHGGQICFPGGQIESGEDDCQAAVREFEEELGVRPENIFICGRLNPVYVYASNNLVHPVVMTCRLIQRHWRPQVEEVDAVIELPVRHVLAAENWTLQSIRRTIRSSNQSSGDFELLAPCCVYNEHQIWGATGMLLARLAQLIACSPPAQEQRPEAES